MWCYHLSRIHGKAWFRRVVGSAMISWLNVKFWNLKKGNGRNDPLYVGYKHLYLFDQA